MAATAVSLANLAPNLTAALERRLISRRRTQQVPFRRTPARSLIAGIPPTSIRPVEKLRVGVLSFGDEGRVQALELKENLKNLRGVEVEVGLMGGYVLPIGTVSAEEDDTQGIMSGNDVVCIFSPDMRLQASSYKNIFSSMKSYSILAISDGSPPGQRRSSNNNKIITTLRANPEEIGTLIRDLNINGAGTNSSLPHSCRSRPRQPRSRRAATKLSNPQRPAMERGRREKRPLRSVSSRSAPALPITGVIAGALMIWVMMRQVVISVLCRREILCRREKRPLRSASSRSAPALLIIGVIAGALMIWVMMRQGGGLLSFFAILLWVATLWLWYKRGNLVQRSGILLSVFSAVVLAVSIAAYLRKVEDPTRAGSSTWPCDDGARTGSCDPACIYLIIIGDQNNVNIYRP